MGLPIVAQVVEMIMHERRKHSPMPMCWLLSLDGTQSVRSRPKYKIEARSFGERTKVPVSREERNASVDAALGNQRVAEACLAVLRQHLRSQLSRSLPIARSDLDQRHFCERFGNAGRKLRVA